MSVSTVRVLVTGDASGYIAATREAAAATDASLASMGGSVDSFTSKSGGKLTQLGEKLSNWGVPFAGSLTKVGAKFDEADTKGQKFGTAMSTLGGAALLGVGAAAVAVGAEAVHMADQFDTAQATLKTAVDDSGQSFKKLSPVIDDANNKMADWGWNSTTSEQALGTLDLATGNVTESIKLESTASDIARMKHEDLNTAAQALAKTWAGSPRLLTQLGINSDAYSGKLTAIRTETQAVSKAQLGLKTTQDEVAAGTLKGAAAADALTSAHMTLSDAEQKLHGSQDAIAQVIDEVSKRVHGQSDAFASTLAGSIDVANAKAHNMGTQLGEYLTPALQHTEHALEDVAVWLLKEKDVLYTVGAAVGIGLGIPMVKFAVETATKFVTGVINMGQSLLNIGAPVQASAAEVEAGGVRFSAAMDAEAASATMTEGEVQGSFEGMGVAAEEGAVTVDTAIGSTGIGLILIGLGLAIGLLLTHWKLVWSTIKDVIHDAVTWVKTHIDDIVLALGPAAPLLAGLIFLGTHWKTVWDDIKKVMSDVWDFLKKIFDDITGAISKVMGPLTSVVGMASKFASGVGSFFGFKADGGPVTGGGAYVVGEAGPEVFIPSTGGTIIPNGGGGTPISGGSAQGGGGDLTVQLIVSGEVLAQQTWRDFQTVFLQNKRSVGPLGLS